MNWFYWLLVGIAAVLILDGFYEWHKRRRNKGLAETFDLQVEDEVDAAAQKEKRGGRAPQ